MRLRPAPRLAAAGQKGLHMDPLQNIAILLIAGTLIWLFLKLKERIELLEHEVRWLRSELDAMKGGHGSAG